MKKIFIALIIVGFVSCSKDRGEVTFEVLKKEVRESEQFSNYKQSLRGLMLAGLNREVSFKGSDSVLLAKKITSVNAKEDLKILYKRAGVQGGEKLAELQSEYNHSLTALLKTFPELKKLTKAEIKEIVAIENPITTAEIETSSKIIKSQNNNEKN